MEAGNEKQGRTQVVSGVLALATTRFGLIRYDDCFIDLIGLFERQLGKLCGLVNTSEFLLF